MIDLLILSFLFLLIILVSLFFDWLPEAYHVKGFDENHEAIVEWKFKKLPLKRPLLKFSWWINRRLFRYYLVLLVVCLILFVIIELIFNLSHTTSYWGGVFIEGHGLLFDILVLGVLQAIYNEKRDRWRLVKEYEEELQDYKDWREPEAAYRVAGIVRRLKTQGVKNIDLRSYFLNGANFQESDLSGTLLDGADLSNTNLIDTDFSNAHFWEDTYLEGAKVDRIDWFDWLRSNGVTGIGKLKRVYTIEKTNEEISGYDVYVLRGLSIYNDRGVKTI